MMNRVLAFTADGGTDSSFDIVQLIGEASGPGLVVLGILVIASVLVWIIWFAKYLQLKRLLGAQRRFEKACNLAHNAEELVELASQNRMAPGATVVRAIGARLEDDLITTDLLAAVARRAVTSEEQRCGVLMPTLSSIASSSPFIGLFGTVWGIMIAFQRIGAEKSASLPVVAPAIGEALVATAFGLFAAIPATIGYNYIDRRITDLMDELNAAADVWVARMYASEKHARQTSSMPRKVGS